MALNSARGPLLRQCGKERGCGCTVGFQGHTHEPQTPYVTCRSVMPGTSDAWLVSSLPRGAALDVTIASVGARAFRADGTRRAASRRTGGVLWAPGDRPGWLAAARGRAGRRGARVRAGWARVATQGAGSVPRWQRHVSSMGASSDARRAVGHWASAGAKRRSIVRPFTPRGAWVRLPRAVRHGLHTQRRGEGLVRDDSSGVAVAAGDGRWGETRAVAHCNRWLAGLRFAAFSCRHSVILQNASLSWAVSRSYMRVSRHVHRCDFAFGHALALLCR